MKDDYRRLELGEMPGNYAALEDFRSGTDLVVEDGFYSRMVYPAEKRKRDPEWMVFTYPEDEPIIEWLYTGEAERLMDVNQHGPHSLYRPDLKVDRFEHSWGVMTLERMFGESRGTQVSALVHDYHGPFSHWSELVFDEDHEHHEERREKAVKNSEYWQTLKESEIDQEKVLEPENFPSLDAPRPDLCADRIDYFLRDLAFTASDTVRDGEYPLRETYLGIDWPEIKDYAQSLVLLEGEKGSVFAISPEEGEGFVRNFFRMDNRLYFKHTNKMIDKVTADAARQVLNDGTVGKEDFWEMTDTEIWETMMQHPEASKRIERLEEVLEEAESGQTFILGGEENADVSVSYRDGIIDPVFVNSFTLNSPELGTRVDLEGNTVEELVQEDNPIRGGNLERASDYPVAEQSIMQKQGWRGSEEAHFNFNNWDYERVKLNV